jgi:hypothetical protein
MASAKLQPALLGGLFIGVLSALPFISAANLCCCLWIIGGGLLASYLAQQDRPEPLTSGEGANLGLLAGTFGAIVHLVISIPMSILLAPLQRRLLEQLLQQAQDVPPELREMIQQVEPAVGGFAFTFVVMLVLGAVFSTLGGFLGTILFRPSSPPAPPIETPPQPYDM